MAECVIRKQGGVLESLSLSFFPPLPLREATPIFRRTLNAQTRATVYGADAYRS